MTINLINPNFNLFRTAQTGANEQSASSAANTANSAAGGAQSFSNALGTVISNGNLDEIFQKASDTYHVPIELLKAVAKAESNFNPTAESHAGAQGIMQLMPGTAKSLGVSNSFDPEQNIMGGAKYLSQQLERFDGNTELALAAYNAGPGNVAKYNGVPPFKETQNYISKVMAYAGEAVTAGDTSMPNAVSGDAMKDYALLMDLYRYRMQLNVLSDSEDSDSNSADFISSLTTLV